MPERGGSAVYRPGRVGPMPVVPVWARLFSV